MEKEILALRAHHVFHLLSCEDPRYPKTNFFLRHMEDIRSCLTSDSNPHDLSARTVQSVMVKAVQQLVMNYEQDTKWKEITCSWFAQDIYEVLKANIEYILR